MFRAGDDDPEFNFNFEVTNLNEDQIKKQRKNIIKWTKKLYMKNSRVVNQDEIDL